MGQAGSTRSIAIPALRSNRRLWRTLPSQERAFRARPSRQKRRYADPTLARAHHRFARENELRAYLAEFVRANRALGIGLLTAKLLDSRRPPRDLSSRIYIAFGVEMTDKDLYAAAVEARSAVQDSVARHFESSPTWHLRWLPEIRAD